MHPADVTAFGGKSKGLRAHLKMCRGFGQVEPLNVPVLWRTVNRDLVVRPQCRHALSRPTVAVTGRELIAIEDASNQVIRGDPDQQPDRCDDILRGRVPLTAPTPRQTRFAMNAAGPMNQQDDLANLSIDVGMTSWISMRTMRFFSRASVVGAAQTDFRSPANVATDAAVASDRGGCRQSWPTMRASNSLTRVNA